MILKLDRDAFKKKNSNNPAKFFFPYIILLDSNDNDK